MISFSNSFYLTDLFSFSEFHFYWFMFFLFIIGICIGSFLNVVIYRAPSMVKNENCSSYYLIYPPSSCLNCQTRIKPWHNIPIVSFLLLRGKCYSCHHKISWRYPLVEMVTGLITMIVFLRFGFSIESFFGCLFSYFVIAMTIIDFDEFILPDFLTLSLLWLGLFLNLNHVFTSLPDAVIGTMIGYLSLWLIFHLFRLVTGKEGMGYGDFKLFAALGAWFGWYYLLPIILIASFSGAIIGTTFILLKKQDKNQPIPFGPFLAIAGWVILMAKEFFLLY